LVANLSDLDTDLIDLFPSGGGRFVRGVQKGAGTAQEAADNPSDFNIHLVTPGLVSGIHVLNRVSARKARMAGT
jgi:hypothetical protein